jgi:hypothetical protein
MFICVPKNPNTRAYKINLKFVNVIDKMTKGGVKLCEVETISASSQPVYFGIVSRDDLIYVPNSHLNSVSDEIIYRIHLQKSIKERAKRRV